MRITGFHVEGFGLLHDQRVDGLGPGTTVVLGPNEAGKSTLHTFLVRTLFGHPRANDAAGRNRYEPLKGGRHGGMLRAVDDVGTWSVHRYAVGQPRLRVVGPDGHEATGEDAVLALLGRSVDATRFDQVFAIDLDDLAGVSSLDDEALTDLLFDAATVGTGRSLRGAAAAAATLRDELWTPRSRNRDLAVALDERASARRALEDARAAAAGNLGLRARLDAAEQRAAALASQTDDVTARIALLDRVRDAWPAWQRVATADATLAELPDLHVTDDVVAQATEANDAIAGLVEQRAALATERRELAAQLAAVATNEELEVLAPVVAELHADLRVHQLTVEQLAAARHERDEARATVGDVIASIGPGWDVDRVLQVATDATSRERLVLATDELTEAVRALELAEGRAAQATAEVARRRRAVEERRRDVAPGPDQAQVARAEQAVAYLQQTVPSLEQAALLREARATGAAPASSSISRGTWVAALLVALLGVAVAGASVLGDALGLLLPLGAVLAVAPVVFVVGRTVGRQSPPVAAEVADDVVTDAVRRQVQAAAEQLGQSGELSSADVQRLATRVAAARAEVQAAVEGERDVARLVEEAQRAVEEASILEDAAAAASAARDERRATWLQLAKELGLDPVDAPRVVLVEHDRVAAAQQALARADRAEAAVAPLEERVESYRHAAAVVQADAGARGLEGEDAVRALSHLHQRCLDAAEARRDEARLRGQLVALDERVASLLAEEATATAALDDALRDAGVQDTDELAETRRVTTARATAQRERAAAVGQLDTLLGTGPTGVEGRQLLATRDPAAWEQQRTAEARRLAELRAERDEAVADRTRLSGELARLGGDDAVPRAAQALDAAEVQVAALTERWAVADTAAKLLEETVARFEREQQPRVLAHASELFAHATRGAWQEIRRLDEELVVSASAGGDPCPVGQLSRGTREQLWLSLRLALAADLSAERPLPLLIDDLLGTSDPDRAEAVAHVLARVAERQQVLLFTCDPGTAELITRTDPSAGVLEMAAGGNILGWATSPPVPEPSRVPTPSRPPPVEQAPQLEF